LFAADVDDAEAGAEGFEGLDGSEDVITESVTLANDAYLKDLESGSILGNL
jgi:hypothetical protein